MAICNICSCSCPMTESICEHCFVYQDEKCPKRMNCTFKKMDEQGNYVKCNNLVLKSNIDKNNQNNNYCSSCQEFVDEINLKRKNEAIKEYKQKLINWLRNEKQWLDRKNFTRSRLVKKGYEKTTETIDKHIDVGFELSYEYFLIKVEHDCSEPVLHPNECKCNDLKGEIIEL